MHTNHAGESVDVAAGVDVSVGVMPGISVNVGTSPVPEIGIKNVFVERGIANTDVAVGVAEGASAPTTAPTITKFAAVLAARMAMNRRRIVMRTRISFSQCMVHLYSSGLGHWSVGQNSKMPFLV